MKGFRVVKGFVCNEEHLDLDLLYEQPVELLKDWGDVIYRLDWG